jgi:hypothetical protein
MVTRVGWPFHVAIEHAPHAPGVISTRDDDDRSEPVLTLIGLSFDRGA